MAGQDKHGRHDALGFRARMVRGCIFLCYGFLVLAIFSTLSQGMSEANPEELSETFFLKLTLFSAFVASGIALEWRSYRKTLRRNVRLALIGAGAIPVVATVVAYRIIVGF